MTARTTDSTDLLADPHTDLDVDPLAGPDPVAAATAHVAARALTPGDEHRVGLELELHLVDLARPGRRPSWTDVEVLADSLPALPHGSSITWEPGSQVELSTAPHEDVVGAVTALRADERALRAALREQGWGAAPLGADPARPVERVNPHPRYAAMERHFEACSCSGPGLSMMTATAALQVNLDAGPAVGWSARLALVRSLVPMLVAASSTSPWLGGRESGWHSMRQQTWHGIDHGRSDPIPAGEPTVAWALYALNAPVMMLRDGLVTTAVTTRVSFAEWLRHPGALGRPATLADLDHHLTTLFPPVRPRGYVELRCVDALPDRWWPALAAMVATLVDDPVAADTAAELCEPVAGAWEAAARHGTSDPALRRAVVGCAAVAAARGPDGPAPRARGARRAAGLGSHPGRRAARHRPRARPRAPAGHGHRGGRMSTSTSTAEDVARGPGGLPRAGPGPDRRSTRPS